MFDECPADWELKTLEDVCEVLDRFRVPLNSTERASRQGNIPYWGANGIVDFIDKAIFNEPLLLMPEDGGPFSEAREKPICHLLDGPAWVNNHAHVLKVVHGLREYVYYWFVHRDITPFLKGGGRAKLNQADMRQLPILVPPLPEQQRIAEILSSVDESIRATEAVIAQAERVKRGLMEDLLTGGLGSAAIANGEVPEGWASDKFINLVTLKRGYDLPVTDRIDGNFLVVASNGPVGTHNIPAVSGPVIVTGRSGTIGKVELYWEDCHPLNTTLYSQNLHGNDPRYVAEYIRFFRLERFATGTGVPTLNRNLVHDETIVIPPLPEQQRIAEILSSVDDQITSNRATVEQLHRLKRGLMDDLLTGKVRTVA